MFDNEKIVLQVSSRDRVRGEKREERGVRRGRAVLGTRIERDLAEGRAQKLEVEFPLVVTSKTASD